MIDEFRSTGGRPNRPGCYHSLLAGPDARLEAGTEAYRVTASASVAEGAERERLRAEQVRRTPCFEGFQERAVRLVPVVVLTRQG
ncbi:nitroreductase/quinone reductase family protein [Streptacidiphilus sp. MAP12-33]|uniref:nitroreductase/quinone reductase family protein n=1 Tax=Streptacidiphilus sp. MAP12-33 TaxID=3156266 RepID=UPI003513228A